MLLGYCISLPKSSSLPVLDVLGDMARIGEEPQGLGKCISTSYPLARTKAVYEGSINY